MRGIAFSLCNHSIRFAAVCIVCGGLTSCGKQTSGEHHWKDVSQLSGGTFEIHFVVIDPKIARDRKAYDDAGETVCSGDLCQIGFFDKRNDVPDETLTADFFENGGWGDRHQTALLFRNTKSGFKSLQFDCSIFPQNDLNSCLSPIKPTYEELKAAQKRGPLAGFGKAKFGMTTEELTAALGGPDKVHVLNPTNNRTILRTKVDYHGRDYNAFYNVTASGFSTVLLRWSDLIDNRACINEAKKIATDVSNDFGEEDNFSYFDAGGKTFRYRWLFADGATAELSNLDMKDDDC